MESIPHQEKTGAKEDGKEIKDCYKQNQNSVNKDQNEQY